MIPLISSNIPRHHYHPIVPVAPIINNIPSTPATAVEKRQTLHKALNKLDTLFALSTNIQSPTVQSGNIKTITSSPSRLVCIHLVTPYYCNYIRL